MNKRQKEVQKHFLKSEKKALKELKKIYRTSLDQVEKNIKELCASDITQSKIYQIDYQMQLKNQLEDILSKLHKGNFETIEKYLNQVYENSFIGTLYDLQGQGIPLLFPMSQEEVAKAIVLDSKISKGLYNALGVNTKMLKGRIASEISRGIASGESWQTIATRLAVASNVDYNKTKRIVRTEGHRIQNASAMDSMNKSKERGADIVKVWDSTLDGKTRTDHIKLDGQIRELDEDFEIDGQTARCAGEFGDPSQDCNCRCQTLQRVRHLTTDRTKFFRGTEGMSDEQKQTLAEQRGITVEELEQYKSEVIPLKAKNFEDFQKQYNKIWHYEE